MNATLYYEMTGHGLTAANMSWTPVLKNFDFQWKTLVELKNKIEPAVPKIKKALPIIKWTDAFRDHTHRIIGTRMVPLAYVLRKDSAVAPVAPPLAQNQCYSTEHGSLKKEMLARASHTHVLFETDNIEMYYRLEEATRGTMYASSIQPFTTEMNGRGAWFALLEQYAGKNKWEYLVQIQTDLLVNSK